MRSAKVPLAVSSVRIQNFKAIQDSKTVRLTPLTVFIGNNGVGKSSLVEGLELIKDIAGNELNDAVQKWRGFEYLWNQAVPHTLRTTPEGKAYQSNPLCLTLRGAESRVYPAFTETREYRAETAVTAGPGDNKVFFLHESLNQSWPNEPPRSVSRDTEGAAVDETVGAPPFLMKFRPDDSILSAETSLQRWQFVRSQQPLHRPQGQMIDRTEPERTGNRLVAVDFGLAALFCALLAVPVLHGFLIEPEAKTSSLD